MTVFDRHVLREWLKVFAMTLGTLAGLLVAVRMIDSIRDFIRWGTSPADIAHFYLCFLPESAPLLLPVAALLSMMLTLGAMHRNQELTAMRAAGWSIFRITRTLWIGGLACAASLFMLNAFVIPAAMESSRELREKEQFDFERETRRGAGSGAGGEPVVFMNARDRRLWRVESLGAYANEAYGVQVWSLRDANRPAHQVFARYARYDAARGVWTFEDGRAFDYPPEAGTAPFTQPEFATREFPEFTEKPLTMALMSKKPSGLSLGEIDTLLNLAGDDETDRTAALRVRRHAIIASPFACLVVVALAIPFAVAGVRTNPMVGVFKAVIAFFLYYVIDKTGYALGEQRELPGLLAAWLPNILALSFAGFAIRRVN